MLMFWTFILSFDQDILAFLSLATVLATFSKIWAKFFSQSSGHPAAAQVSPAITCSSKGAVNCSIFTRHSTRRLV
jgi:hypothetical protein